jgi:hypothetical protein
MNGLHSPMQGLRIVWARTAQAGYSAGPPLALATGGNGRLSECAAGPCINPSLRVPGSCVEAMFSGPIRLSSGAPAEMCALTYGPTRGGPVENTAVAYRPLRYM